MTWKEAIKKVLADEGKPLHYSEITNKIIEAGYRSSSEMGATPDMTVNAQLSTQKDLFEKLGGGMYSLKSATPAASSSSAPSSPEKKKSSVKSAEASIEHSHIIKNYGMYWSRNAVNWKSQDLLGSQNGSSETINFKNQIGIYMLHDAREVIYVGQAVKQSIAKRLSDHCKDRLSGRWDRFSWFGFYGVDEKGELVNDEFEKTVFSVENVANAFEAILIEGLEPRQNRKAGNEFGYEFLQVEDPEIQKRKMKLEMFDAISKI